jgi:hypothetical protein
VATGQLDDVAAAVKAAATYLLNAPAQLAAGGGLEAAAAAVAGSCGRQEPELFQAAVRRRAATPTTLSHTLPLAHTTH